MNTADTILFLGLVALAYWLEETRLQAVAGAVGIAAGLSAVALAPSPWVGLTVLITGIYMVVVAVRAARAARRSREDGS